MAKQTTVKKPSAGGRFVLRDTRSEKALVVETAERGVTMIYRDAKTGSFTSRRSATRIRDTSTRAADSLKRLAKR